MIAFESRKRSANPNKMTSLNVALPFSFIDYYRKNVGSDVRFDKNSFKLPNANLDWTSHKPLWES